MLRLDAPRGRPGPTAYSFGSVTPDCFIYLPARFSAMQKQLNRLKGGGSGSGGSRRGDAEHKKGPAKKQGLAPEPLFNSDHDCWSRTRQVMCSDQLEQFAQDRRGGRDDRHYQ